MDTSQEQNATEQPRPAGNGKESNRSSTSELAEIVERLHSRIDHADDRVTSGGVRVVASVATFLLLVFAVAQYVQPRQKDLSKVDSRLLWIAALLAAGAFVLALISLAPRRIAHVDGYVVEKAADGTAATTFAEFVAQEANEAGSRQAALRSRGRLVFAAICLYAVSSVCSAGYLYVVVISK